ncbi:hypothetical protein AJ88_18730 [Mesorhizobium amorphae CCBAU 01583]|nr:hypothetical protein AJ88_18730 [Mesorhizobium amorphae CCBAU 01583]
MIGAEAEHPAARRQRQRVGLARRPGQVDLAEIDAGGSPNGRGALAAQMLPEDGDPIRPRRPAA